MPGTKLTVPSAGRPRWLGLATGITLIVVAVALTVAWQVIGVPWAAHMSGASTARWIVYFLGSLLFLLLIGGLILAIWPTRDPTEPAAAAEVLH